MSQWVIVRFLNLKVIKFEYFSTSDYNLPQIECDNAFFLKEYAVYIGKKFKSIISTYISVVVNSTLSLWYEVNRFRYRLVKIQLDLIQVYFKINMESFRSHRNYSPSVASVLYKIVFMGSLLWVKFMIVKVSLNKKQVYRLKIFCEDFSVPKCK